MLALSRKLDEKIMIGDDIEITVLGFRRGKVRIGITAPANVPVHRQEVYLAKKAEEAEAARSLQTLENEGGATREARS